MMLLDKRSKLRGLWEAYIYASLPYVVKTIQHSNFKFFPYLLVYLSFISNHCEQFVLLKIFQLENNKFK